jgi:hypothetical protein
MNELVRPQFFTHYLLFRSSIFLLYYVLMIRILIMQIWNFASRRRLMLQSPLDTPDLRYLSIIIPYALCYGYLIFITPYAQDLLSRAQYLLS